MPAGIYIHKKGRPVSEETRRKMSAIHKGKTISEKQKKEHSEFMKKSGFKPPSFLGKKHSYETKKKMSERFKGKNSHFWNGGKCKENKRIRESLEYRTWRELVFKRDNYTCVLCKQVGGDLNADHIQQFAYYPKLRFDINNGRTLCVECHKKTDTFKKKIPCKKKNI